MFYKFVKIWANISFRFYFRRIFISGTEHIPKNGAVLFIVNHPNSFLEACLVASFQHRDLHFLVRGDMFEKKWLKPFLRWTNQIPIFRFKDGFTKMKKNKSTFDESFKVLAEKKALLIFPEASTLMVKYLRPLQKGAARLAVGCIEEYNMEQLYVIPTGVYYSAPKKARSDVIIRFGPSLEVRKWLSTCTEQSDKLAEITQTFEKHLDKVVVSIGPEQDVKEFDRLCEVVEPKLLPYAEKQNISAESAFEKMKQFALNFKILSKHQQNEIHHLLNEYGKSFSSLKALNFRLTKSIFERCMLPLKISILFLLGLPGIMVYGIPFILVKQFSKAKIKSNEFYSAVRLALSMFAHAILSVCLFWSGSQTIGMQWTILSLLLLQVSLLCFMINIDLLAYSRYTLKSLSAQDKSQRLKIVHSIEKMFAL